MYRVMIVDDEPIIVEGLSRSIPWERWNCQVVATANERAGRKGSCWKSISRIMMFIDICMPEMSRIAANRSQ